MSVNQWPGGASTTPHSWSSQHPPLGDVIEGVGPATNGRGEESEGDTTMIQALPSLCSLGTCLTGGGDCDGWAELDQVPGHDP